MKPSTMTHARYTEALVQWWSWYAHADNARRFANAYHKAVDGAESSCVHCGSTIYLDTLEGCGVPDWKTKDGDYGCDANPASSEDGCHGHEPRRL